MTIAKSLPPRPSLDSLRKQAKKLARDIAAGDAAALARARTHLPNVGPPLTQRNAQLVIAREYGFAGWQELTAEVSKRLGEGFEWAVKQAARIIHDNDVERLEELLAEYPALLSWKGAEDPKGLLEHGHERLWRRRRSTARAIVHARGVRRAAPRRRRDRGSGSARRASQVTRKRPVAAVSPEGPAAAHARVLCGVGRPRGRSQRSRRERVRSRDRQRIVRVRLPLRSRTDRVVAAGTLHRARSGACARTSTGDRPPSSFIASSKKRTPKTGRRHTDFGRVFVMEQISTGRPRPRSDGVRPPATARAVAARRRLGRFSRRAHRDAGFSARSREIHRRVSRSRSRDPAAPAAAARRRAIDCGFMYANTHLLPLLTRIWPVPDALPFAAGNG